MLGSLAAVGSVTGQLHNAYSKTPEGAKEAAADAVNARKAAIEVANAERSAAARAKRAEAEKAANDAKVVVEVNEKRLKNCFSTFGNEIPALSRQVRDSLNNPRSFEHVKTEIGDVPLEFNVYMQYRAQNGFGAIITTSVWAKINPDDCSVTDVEYRHASG